jgi:PAS domain S-box-containing protein
LKIAGTITSFEVELRRKDGSLFWGAISARQVTDKDGNFIFIDGVLQDITQRKQAETDLRLKESAIASSINAIGITDLEGTLTYVNDSLVKMWGYQHHDEILGRNVAEFFEGDGALDTMETLREKGKKAGEDIGKRKDGSLFDVEFSANLINDEAGKPVYMFSSFFDISERKELQEGLRLSKEFNQSILTSLPEHIAVLDLEGTILDVNDAWIKFARQKDVVSLCCADPGVNYLRFCREASDKGDAIATDAHNGIRSVLNGSSRYFEMEFPCDCDSPTEKHWFLMSVSPFKGAKGGVIVALTDITSRKRAEIELRDANTEISELQKQLEAESAYLQDEIKLEHNFENIIGQSEGLKYVLHRVEQVAPLESTVLILGETGTGKELIARALHKLSSHSKRALIKVNCAALPGELIESELFGHEKGAFTGATTTQFGRFELANGSTLFLDEIGELPLELQAKLLRVLESGEFERLGSSRPLHSDARIIAATNRSLEEEVRKGRFREDLWYRLKVFPITVPTLRDRMEDIPLLVNWFVEFFARKMGKRALASEIPKRTMQALQAYSWPGNVRELMHVVEGALITAEGKKLNFDLPKIADVLTSDFKSLEEMERQYILDVLKAKNWKIGGEDSAASTLGMPSSTLRSRMKKLGLKRS